MKDVMKMALPKSPVDSHSADEKTDTKSNSAMHDKNLTHETIIDTSITAEISSKLEETDNICKSKELLESCSVDEKSATIAKGDVAKNNTTVTTKHNNDSFDRAEISSKMEEKKNNQDILIEKTNLKCPLDPPGEDNELIKTSMNIQEKDNDSKNLEELNNVCDKSKLEETKNKQTNLLLSESQVDSDSQSGEDKEMIKTSMNIQEKDNDSKNLEEPNNVCDKSKLEETKNKQTNLHLSESQVDSDSQSGEDKEMIKTSMNIQEKDNDSKNLEEPNNVCDKSKLEETKNKQTNLLLSESQVDSDSQSGEDKEMIKTSMNIQEKDNDSKNLEEPNNVYDKSKLEETKNKQTNLHLSEFQVDSDSHDGKTELKSETTNQNNKSQIIPEHDNDILNRTEIRSKYGENKNIDKIAVLDNKTEDSGKKDSDDQSSHEDTDDLKEMVSDAVSINSDSDSHSDIILVENQSEFNFNRSPDVLEISDGDDCVVTGIKRPSFGRIRRQRKKRKNRKSIEMNFTIVGDVESIEDESDIEVIPIDDPLDEGTKNSKNYNDISLDDTFEIKSNNNTEKDLRSEENDINKNETEHQLTIASDNNKDSFELCSIAARGITITPVKNKPNPATTPNEPLLPTLTDDMFVLEVPSFITPFMYEKPSLKPFREFVDILGKEVEDKKKAREIEKVRLKKVAMECSEKMVDSEEDSKGDAKRSSKENKVKKAQRKKNDDDASWEESTDDSDDPTLSGDEYNVDIFDDDDTLGIGVNKLPTVNKPSNSYFDYGIGKLLTNIGSNLVQEYVQTDLVKQQTYKLAREKKTGHSTKITATKSSIASLNNNLQLSKERNKPFSFPQKKCKFCTFKTESEIVLKHHLEVPHMKNNLYQCNFCPYEIRNPHESLLHMKNKHGINGRLERGLISQQCANCPYEDNSKAKLARHVVACAKRFKPNFNLTPPLDWECPAKLPKKSKSRELNGGPTRNVVNQGSRQLTVVRSAPVSNINPVAPSRIGTQSSVLTRGSNPAQSQKSQRNLPRPQPSLSINGLVRAPVPVATTTGPTAAPAIRPLGKTNFVICEMCDGYIKDMEQLRNHMQWIHKVKIHPKMIHNRPPLNCQKCQFRFFTDHGLERHLLGSHGLVPTSMQEAANKGKDAGRCPICGRVFQWKLLTHVANDHKMSLSPAYLTYKCTVCTETFTLYKKFEEHVYTSHRVSKKKKDTSQTANSIETAKNSGLTITAVTKNN